MDAAAGCMGNSSSATVMVLQSLPDSTRGAALRRHAAARTLRTLSLNGPLASSCRPGPKGKLHPRAAVDIAKLLTDTKMAVDEGSTRTLIAACRDTPDRFGLLDILAACDLLALLCAMQRCEDAEGASHSTALVTGVLMRIRERITALRQRKSGQEGLPDEVLTIVNGLNATEKALAMPTGCP